MKIPALLKRQQYKDSRSDETKLKGSKRQRLDERDNEEGNGLDKHKNEIKGARYILSPFVPLFLLSQKVSNRPSNLSKVIKSLNCLVCISKIYYSRSANFTLKILGKEGSKI